MTPTCTKWACAVVVRAVHACTSHRLIHGSGGSLLSMVLKSGWRPLLFNPGSYPWYLSGGVTRERDAHDDTSPRPRAGLRLFRSVRLDSGGRKIWFSGGLVSQCWDVIWNRSIWFLSRWGPLLVQLGGAGTTGVFGETSPSVTWITEHFNRLFDSLRPPKKLFSKMCKTCVQSALTHFYIVVYIYIYLYISDQAFRQYCNIAWSKLKFDNFNVLMIWGGKIRGGRNTKGMDGWMPTPCWIIDTSKWSTVESSFCSTLLITNFG